MGWLAGWSKRQKITIDHTQIDSDLTNFPIKVITPSDNPLFNVAKSDGADIRFTASDGMTLLDFEREVHDGSQLIAVYHVKVPFVSSTTDTDIYVYYGNPNAADASNPSAVWDSDYSIVLHMGPSLTDSTNNNNNMTNYGSTLVLNGDGYYRSFDGADDYLYRSSITNVWTSYFTTEVLIKATDDDGYIWQMDRSPSNTIKESIFQLSSGNLRFWDYDGTYGFDGTSTSTINNGIWRTASFSKNTITGKFYIDGQQDNQITADHDIAYVGNDFTIGKNYRDNDHFFAGNIGELRISSIARPDAWIKATSATLRDQLLAFGKEETLVTMMLAFNF